MSENAILLVLISLVAMPSFVFGLFGILYKQKINDSSQLCRSVNNLMFGIMMLVVLILDYIYGYFRPDPISKDDFYKLLIIGMTITFFVTGLHGILNKNKINNQIFYIFSRQKLVGSIIIVVGLVAFWLIWHR